MAIAGVDAVYIVFAIVAALGGGALGASIGALPSFIFTGFLTIAGSVQQITTGETTLFVAAFGPLFGAHVGFAGGCAAHAYAAKRMDLQSQDGWEYHDAKNILVSLGTKPDVLLVGAVFGAGAQALKMFTDFVTGLSPAYGFGHIAWIIVVSAFVHRYVFGYPVIGDREKIAERVGSSTDDTSWLSFDYDEAEPHLPWQFYWSWVIVLGVLIGLVSGYVTIITENPWLTFGISAASLVFLEFDAGFRPGTDLAGMPVTHHITLPSAVAALAALQVGGVPYAMLWAVIFGVLGALFRELSERVFYAWGDTHLDPPAVSITITVVIAVILSALGVLGPNAYLGIGLHRF
jgi:hypothetical protein